MEMQFKTVQQALEWAESKFEQAGLFYGHGTDNAWDDAVAIMISVLDLPADVDESILQRELSEDESNKMLGLFEQRIAKRIPTPYLTKQTWFCGLPFYVDERVIIPRSPIAELIEQQFEPWIDASSVSHVLDLCCGSACIAIACAYAFPDVSIDALDISEEALAVAKINQEKHQVEKQVNLIQSDLFSALDEQRYDIIVTNPPYVDAEDFVSMPDEFQHEPKMALVSGQDGLDATRIILRQARQYLTNKGVLIVEVGNSAEALENAFPSVDFMWLSFDRGGDGIFILTANQLDDYHEYFQ